MKNKPLIEARKAIQRQRDLGVGAAQAYCAEIVCASVNTWIAWETGHRKMNRLAVKTFEEKTGLSVTVRAIWDC